jgi:chromosome segregation ATPase
MKTKVVLVVLLVACVGLVVGLFATKVTLNQTESQHTNDVASIVEFSNQLVDANGELKDLREVNISLTNDLAMSRAQATQLSNNLASALATIAEARTSLAGAEDEVTNLTTHVSELEVQNRVLDERVIELTNTLAQMDTVISNTESQLALTTTNNAYLQSELQSQMAQRSELEHKFNDINEVRSQIAKLKEELFIQRHVKLMQGNNNIGKKGAEMLISRMSQGTNGPARPPSNYDLNVEVGSDGSVKVIPPVSTTNSAAH